jgi:hypothetical protein
MKLLTTLIFVAGFYSNNVHAWEKLCEFEGPGLSGKVSFVTYYVQREQRSNGRWNYRIRIPMSVGDRCGIGQYPVAKVSMTIFMTKNKIFETGEFKRYQGNHTLEQLIENEDYFECIGGDYWTSYDCKY